jgi:ankyrin repeat protein
MWKFIITITCITGITSAIIIGFLGGLKKQAPLIRAIMAENDYTVKTLLNTKANPNVTSNKGTPALILAIENNNYKYVTMLLDAGANPNQTDDYGYSPLAVTVILGNPKIIPLLVKAGANINKSLALSRDTPLTDSVKNKQNKIASTLLNQGASPNRPGDYGITPLTLAQFKEDAKMTELLINYGAEETNGLERLKNDANLRKKLELKTTKDNFYNLKREIISNLEKVMIRNFDSN